MKKAVPFVLLFLCLIHTFSAAVFAYSAEAYCVIETESGDTVFASDEDKRLPMASTTKIMTALLILENRFPSDTFVIPAEACGTEGSSVYLIPGEKMTVEALVSAILLNSANDAAAAGAILIGGSIPEFADMMNERAEEIGMKDTHFVNPHGLDAADHFTTAHDLALLIREAIRNPDFLRISGTYRKDIPMNGTPDARLLINHNKLLRTLPGCISGKTGYTKTAGRCLVSVCERDGVTLAAVTLNDPDDWDDHAALYNAAFPLFLSVCPAEEKEWRFDIPVKGGESESAAVSNPEAFRTVLRRHADGSTPDITVRPILPPSLTAPVKEGEAVGSLVIYSEDTPIGSLPLSAEQGIARAEEPITFWQKFCRFLKKIFSARLTL